MKRCLAWTLAHACYWLGDAISRIMNNRAACVLYPAYSRLMCWSAALNDWGGLELWNAPGAKE